MVTLGMVDSIVLSPFCVDDVLIKPGECSVGQLEDVILRSDYLEVEKAMECRVAVVGRGREEECCITEKSEKGLSLVHLYIFIWRFPEMGGIPKTQI